MIIIISTLIFSISLLLLCVGAEELTNKQILILIIMVLCSMLMTLLGVIK